MRENIIQAQQSSEHTDITLVAKDGLELPVHRCLLPSLAALTEEVWWCEQPRLVLAQETSTTLRCLVALLYKGTCNLQGTTALEVLEALGSLGVFLPEASLEVVLLSEVEERMALSPVVGEERGAREGGEEVLETLEVLEKKVEDWEPQEESRNQEEMWKEQVEEERKVSKECYVSVHKVKIPSCTYRPPGDTGSHVFSTGGGETGGNWEKEQGGETCRGQERKNTQDIMEKKHLLAYVKGLPIDLSQKQVRRAIQNALLNVTKDHLKRNTEMANSKVNRQKKRNLMQDFKKNIQNCKMPWQTMEEQKARKSNRERVKKFRDSARKQARESEGGQRVSREV